MAALPVDLLCSNNKASFTNSLLLLLILYFLCYFAEFLSEVKILPLQCVLLKDLLSEHFICEPFTRRDELDIF